MACQRSCVQNTAGFLLFTLLDLLSPTQALMEPLGDFAAASVANQQAAQAAGAVDAVEALIQVLRAPNTLGVFFNVLQPWMRPDADWQAARPACAVEAVAAKALVTASSLAGCADTALAAMHLLMGGR